MKHCIAFLLFLALLLCAALAEDAPSGLFAFTAPEEAPDGLGAALCQAASGDFSIVSGYATLRWGEWRYGQAVIKDAEGYALCGLDYLDGQWRVMASHAALRQSEAPRLSPEAVEYAFSDDQIGQSDGCDQFHIIYPDVAYTWSASGDGWRLSRITTVKDSFCTGRNRLSRDSEFIYCPLPVTLGEFDAAAFPTDWAALKALSDGSVYADDTQGLTHALDDAAFVPLLRSPGARAGETFDYYLYSDVPVSVGQEQDGYVFVTVGGMSGWIKREEVYIGAERAAGNDYLCGPFAQVYGYGAQREQPLYARPGRSAEIIARAPVHAYIHLWAVSAEAEHAWFLVRLEDDTIGFMTSDAVCDTDNMHDAWIYSKDPARRLHLRQGPGRKYDSLGRYYSGVEVVMLPPLPNPVQGWSKVHIQDAMGYVMDEYLDYSSDYVGREWLPPLGTVQGVNGNGLNLRQAPSTDSVVIASYPRGEKAEILGVVDSIWAHVRLRDGSSGYMMLQYLGGEPKKAAKNSFSPIVSSAMQYCPRWVQGNEYAYEETEPYPRGAKVRIAQRPVPDAGAYLPVRDKDHYDNVFWIKGDDFDFWQ